MNDNRPSLAAIAAGGARWWIIFTVVFFLTFPLWSRGLLAVLRFVLEGLNGLGAA